MLGASFADMFSLNVILRGITAQTFLQTRTFTFKILNYKIKIHMQNLSTENSPITMNLLSKATLPQI